MHENWARPSATVSVSFETDRAAHLHSVPLDHHAPPTHVHRTLSHVWPQQENPIPISLPPPRSPVSGSALLLPRSRSALLSVTSEHHLKEPAPSIFMHLRVAADRRPHLHSS
jgi:hypothetical protein